MECYDAIVTGKVTFEIFSSEEKITMVDLEDWEKNIFGQLALMEGYLLSSWVKC